MTMPGATFRLVLSALLAPHLLLASEAPWPDEDLWYTVRIADAPVGSLHTTVTGADGRYTSTEAMHVIVNRGDDKSEMKFHTDFVEYDESSAPEGVPRAVETSYVQDFATQQIRMHAQFSASQIHLTSFNGEAEHSTTAPLEDVDWAARLQSRRQFREGCLRGDAIIKYRTVRPELGPKVVEVASMLAGKEQLTVQGEETAVLVWDVAIAGVPVNMTEVYPASGDHACARLVQMRMAMPFGELRATLSNRGEAERAATHVEGQPLPELVYAMFVPLKERIRSVNECFEVGLRVSLRDEVHVLDLPTAGYQTVAVERKTDAGPRQVLVKVNLEAPVRATAAELADPAFREASAMVDTTDELLQKLAKSVEPDAAGARGAAGAAARRTAAEDLEVALALRELVYDHILTKDLTTAFASASEVARTRAGDCTEHAVLLAALLRTRGIPARVCHGLVYVERLKDEFDRDGAAVAVTPDGHVAATGGEDDGWAGGGNVDESAIDAQFGWHMWTQALVSGVWIDLDATLTVPYNVGHVLVGTSSMADVEGHYQHMSMAGLIGNLDMDLVNQRYEPSSLE